MTDPQLNTFQNQLLLYGLTGGTIAGPQGIQGVQGVQGFLGNLGNQGFQGSIGPIGNQGWQGYQGYQGEFGIQGDVGLQGRQGDVGAGIATTNYTPILVSGGNLSALAGAVGAYATIGSKKFAWGSGSWSWTTTSQTGGTLGNTPSISFPSGYFTTVQQFIVSTTEVGGDAIQFVNGDLSGLNTVGNFWAFRPTVSGSGPSFFFTMSFLAIGV